MIRFEKAAESVQSRDATISPIEKAANETDDAAKAAARHRKSDTDGTLRRKRQAFEDNRLI